MAFQLPAVPNFNPTIPVQPDIIQKYGQMLALKNMLGQQQRLPLELQSTQQQVQQQGIQTQEVQMDLESRKNLQRIFSDPKQFDEIFSTHDPNETDNGLPFDPNTATAALIKNGVQAKDALPFVNQFVDRASKMADIAKANAQAGTAQAEIRSKGYEALANRIEPILDMPAAKASAALDDLKKELATSPQAFAGVPQSDLALVYSATLDHLPAIDHMLGLDANIAKAAQAQASAAKTEAELPGGPLSPPKVAEAEAASPIIQKSKEDVAKAEGEARGAIEIQVQNAIKKQGNAAVADVAPNLVAPAIAAATKAGEDYAQNQSVTQRLQDMMTAAEKGNVVSYQLLPQEGALQVTTSQGVHRINMAEIENYGGGSLWQKMEGHFGKALTGKSIPDSVLKDMAAMQKIYEEGARTKYDNTIKTINESYGSTFKPIEMPTAQEQQNAPVLPSVTFKGVTYTPEQLKAGGYEFNAAKHQWEKK